ncbi:hypothetical protein BCR43DRAFT_496740 [Syncephalastrum racemosum]|uniref:Pyridoxal phosphate-dependent transferase n=1 Tax=Syncephalastrum racemosum TaxID=13706 RepID=A0A1X2H4K0_SYNRA|nr:hypothetical protein BCR43DRAFT_496740 [Syncephalastrum racemosum]
MLDTSKPQLCLRQHIQGIKAALHERLHHGLWIPIQKHLIPLGCQATLPRGGYFVWLRLPDGMNFEMLDKSIQDLQLDISVGSGTLFAVPGQPAFHDCLRLCFAHYNPQQLAYGIQKLAEAVEHTGSRKY